MDTPASFIPCEHPLVALEELIDFQVIFSLPFPVSSG